MWHSVQGKTTLCHVTFCRMKNYFLRRIGNAMTNSNMLFIILWICQTKFKRTCVNKKLTFCECAFATIRSFRLSWNLNICTLLQPISRTFIVTVSFIFEDGSAHKKERVCTKTFQEEVLDFPNVYKKID